MEKTLGSGELDSSNRRLKRFNWETLTYGAYAVNPW
jgi:hypothetical protein